MRKPPEGGQEQPDLSWEQIVANAQQELNELSPEEQIDVYINAMAAHNVATKKAIERQKGAPTDQDVDNVRNRAMALATLIKGNNVLSPEEILKRIEEKTKEGLGK